MNKHTPAPWLINVKDKFCYEDWLYITDDKDRVICKVSSNWEQLNVNEANAKLIAAAPELLGALRVMTSLCRIKYGNLDKEVYEEILKSEAAIKKATE